MTPAMEPPTPSKPVGGTPEIRPFDIPPVDAPIMEAFVDPPAPFAGRRNTIITSADDDLSELIGKLAPNSATLRKG